MMTLASRHLLLLGSIILALLVARVRPARACTPVPARESAWVNDVVFVGVSLESGPVSNRMRATRYRVEASNRYEKGDEVTVFSHENSCLGYMYPAGVRAVVVADDDGPLLMTSLVNQLTHEERGPVMEALGLSEDFVPTPIASRNEGPSPCSRPKTLTEGFGAADAVMYTREAKTCLNETSGMVEAVMSAAEIYKGPSIQQWFILVHPPELRRGSEDEYRAFRKKHQMNWPIAEFLKELPNPTNGPAKTYFRDDCLEPLPPRGSTREVRAEIAPFFSGPAHQKGKGRPSGPWPDLSCATFGEDVEEQAAAQLEKHKKRIASREVPPLRAPTNLESAEGAKEDSVAAAGPAEASGSGGAPVQTHQAPSPTRPGCASCAAGARIPAPPGLIVLVGILFGGFASRRRRGCAPPVVAKEN